MLNDVKSMLFVNKISVTPSFSSVARRVSASQRFRVAALDRRRFLWCVPSRVLFYCLGLLAFAVQLLRRLRCGPEVITGEIHMAKE